MGILSSIHVGILIKWNPWRKNELFAGLEGWGTAVISNLTWVTVALTRTGNKLLHSFVSLSAQSSVTRPDHFFEKLPGKKPSSCWVWKKLSSRKNAHRQDSSSFDTLFVHVCCWCMYVCMCGVYRCGACGLLQTELRVRRRLAGLWDKFWKKNPIGMKPTLWLKWKIICALP